MADGWKGKMISCLNIIFVVLISARSILERKDDKSFKRDIIVLISFPICFCFNFFSGKYWKRNVPSGVLYQSNTKNVNVSMYGTLEGTFPVWYLSGRN